tara:strand:- start:276 stop:557 length:282 start_codon:yes stop_codon:yes gene_type:complete
MIHPECICTLHDVGAGNYCKYCRPQEVIEDMIYERALDRYEVIELEDEIEKLIDEVSILRRCKEFHEVEILKLRVGISVRDQEIKDLEDEFFE